MKKERGKPVRGIFEKEPGSGVWWIRWVDGDGIYRREKCGSWATAKARLTIRRQEALDAKLLPANLRCKGITFNEIADDALRYSEQHKRSYRDDKSRMKLLKEWFGERAADSLTAAEIEERLSDDAGERKWAASTYNHFRSLIGMTFRIARRAKKVNINPARDVAHKTEDNSRVRWLNQNKPLPTTVKYLKPLTTEEERLRAVMAHDFAEHLPAYDLAISTGLRMSSLYGLMWEMVDSSGRMLNIPTSKNGAPLHIPLNASAMAALLSVHWQGKRAGRIFRSEKTGEPLLNWRHWMPKAIKTAGIVDFRGHDLRHVFATKLRMKGAKLEDIAQLLGHKGLSMTKRYAHLGPEQLHAVAALLDSHSTPVAPAAQPPSKGAVSMLN